MGGLVQGAALGAAFELLFISVIDATQKVASFSSDLNRLKSTLCSIKVAIDDIESFNRILERPQHETEAFTVRLMEGEKLIRKCSKVKWFNVFMRLYYSKKLSKLEASLGSFFRINVAALHFRESKRISVVVSNLEKKMNEITTMLKRSEIGGCSSNCLSEIVVEFEQSCQGNKGMLLEDGGNVVELSVPPGCGETTVAKILS
ncbi:hypothetical protein Pfo_008725 [Paulownia fortunei]|nr:hypothetical protein Pfo_008725 [Paulownia fortunei]